jgi:hypothetical protein
MYAAAQKEDKGLDKAVEECKCVFTSNTVHFMYHVLPNSGIDDRIERVCLQVPHEALRR